METQELYIDVMAKKKKEGLIQGLIIGLVLGIILMLLIGNIKKRPVVKNEEKTTA